jgi:FtsH-binding integral membrane protein
MAAMIALSLPLVGAAAAVAVAHTALGPDHYLPFVMLARARRWSRPRTLLVTVVCGTAHVLSSVALGMVGLAIGAGLGWVQRAEGMRGDWAAWILVGLGTGYALWGVRTALRRKSGLEPHEHGGHVHVHPGGTHHHHHAGATPRDPSTFWALFIVFALGPCEPLFPLFLVPASRGDWMLAGVTAVVFGLVTLVTMSILVLAAHAGFERFSLGPLERWSHAAAGTVIAASGLAILFLGL